MPTRQTAGTRARDSDRDDTCKVLDTAMAEGQLSMEEHRQRVAAATTAATLGELQSLVSDLQTGSSPVKLPDLKPERTARAMGAGGGWGIRAAAAAVLVIFGIAVGWGLYGNTSSPFSFQTDPGAKADGIPATVLTAPRQLQSLGGLNGLFEQMRQKFGDTNGYDLTIFDDYASLERPDPNEPRRVLSYSYRGGWDDPSETSTGSDARVVDLAAFDVPKFVGLIRGAPQTLGIDPAEVKSLHVSIGPNTDMTAPPESIEISIYVTPNFGNSGYIEFNGDATVKRINYPSS
ncbi:MULTISPECIES: DUF1707 SHOCT-like domain-containing protein [Mycobacteriaceae]|uniref:DUF1707 domain-containing protein n=1 Tax=Mycolicibacterium neoaurum VKM Ac-1815D TaxID=700508 RepID=V5X666_MYCNE|nr:MULTISPECIES: DUF1707 domain-containing protein [Mycobacteriaceae]AHC23507.1 membrane protein [Mycolicibacterium neoaurum VKM Ac-1815D]AMO04210.1 membrane protein [Mycolicibacterium neoaurum]AXK77511.1 DUF1707 domain-containing protein [Mycolicibacterium neoaurum]KJQ48655.1 membrane protein [Mycolicibacterium neoaurum]KUM08694.1 hypothetical protein AVZ31_10025 [Mycolicibacterium neoaurum]